jgi:hypothetical protein
MLGNAASGFAALALAALLLAGCAGLDASQGAPGEDRAEDEKDPFELEMIPLLREYPIPEDLMFFPVPFSWPAAAPGVGVITREQNDPAAGLGENEQKTLAESFRTAYIDGLLRQSSLEGVLGGDFVHGWPAAAPLGWVQNWRDRGVSPNTWGTPSLVLAIQDISGSEAFIVRGPILNMYGKSRGLNGANGIAGYGAPLGGEFPYNGGVAQWFGRGLIHVDAAGAEAFTPGSPVAPEGETAVPETTEETAGSGRAVREAFRKARRRGIYSNLPNRTTGDPAPALVPDGPIRRIGFSERRWEIPADSGAIRVDVLYFQSFNRGRVLLLLAQSWDVPFQTRIIAGSFLNAFLAGEEAPLPGTGTPSAPVPMAAPGGLIGAIFRGLGRYGLPLTDPYPAPEGGTYRETQRFSRGRMGYRQVD